jgi:hypothetical protein
MVRVEMLLLPGEHLVRSAYAVIEAEHRPEGVRGPGVLYLTNHRLVFEAPSSRGLVRDFVQGRDSRLVFDRTLSEIQNVTVRRGRLGRERLVVDATNRHPSFDVLDPEAWVTAVAQAKRLMPPPGVAAPMLIERQVVKVRCRYCGNLANEVDGRCPYCGAAL